MPDQTTYVEGEELDLTGLVISDEFSNGRSRVATDITTNPIAGTALMTVGEHMVEVS